jgi:hypothetical protein
LKSALQAWFTSNACARPEGSKVVQAISRQTVINAERIMFLAGRF